MTMALVLSCVIYLLGLMILLANGEGLKGTEFWFGYPLNLNPSYLRVVVVSEYTGLADIAYNEIATRVALEPRIAAIHDIDEALEGRDFLIENKGIMVNATMEVNVFVLTYSPFSSDASAVLPTSLLSNSYIASAGSSFQNGGLIFIISPSDYNDVNVSLRLESGSFTYLDATYTTGDVLSLQMNRSDIFQIWLPSSLTGTVISSTEPIAVLFGDDNSNVYWRHTLQMALPMQLTSYYFIVPVFQGVTYGYLTVVASEDNTNVSVGDTTWNLQTMENISVTVDVGLPSVIKATRGVFATVYVYDLYDTFMITIPGVDQYMFQYNFFVFNESFNSSISIVIRESSNVSMIMMDGDPIDTLQTAFIDVNNTNYIICTLYVLPGVHFITHLTQQKFGLFVYGAGENNAYGYVPDLNIGQCASNPCENGKTCNTGVNGYTCACAAGYTGVNCSESIDECSSSPCQNGGICNDAIKWYTCTCAARFTGVECAIRIIECASLLCRHGGTCTDMVNSFICTCPSGYTGVTCETDVTTNVSLQMTLAGDYTINEETRLKAIILLDALYRTTNSEFSWYISVQYVSISLGSLIITHSLVVREIPEINLMVAAAVNNITGRDVRFDNESSPVAVENVSIPTLNFTATVNTSACEILDVLSPCNTSETCYEDNTGVPVCSTTWD